MRAPQPVQACGQDHRAAAVDRGERPPQQSGAVLPFAPYHQVVEGFDHQAEDAADHEQPEDVEEFQLDVALAARIAPEHAFGDCLLVFAALVHAPEGVLQAAFPQQPRIEHDGQGHENRQLDHRRDQVPVDADERQGEHAVGDGQGDDGVRPSRRVLAAVAQQEDAEDDHAGRGDEHDADLDAGQDEGQVQHVDDGVSAQDAHDAANRDEDECGDGDDAVQQDEDAVDAGDEGQAAVVDVHAAIAVDVAGQAAGWGPRGCGGRCLIVRCGFHCPHASRCAARRRSFPRLISDSSHGHAQATPSFTMEFAAKIGQQPWTCPSHPLLG